MPYNITGLVCCATAGQGSSFGFCPFSPGRLPRSLPHPQFQPSRWLRRVRLACRSVWPYHAALASPLRVSRGIAAPRLFRQLAGLAGFFAPPKVGGRDSLNRVSRAWGLLSAPGSDSNVALPVGVCLMASLPRQSRAQGLHCTGAALKQKTRDTMDAGVFYPFECPATSRV